MLTEDNLQRLYRYSFTLTCNEEDAYDLLQSAVEKYLNTQQSTEHEVAYLRKIIKNQYIDNYRHQKKLEFVTYDETVIALDNNLNGLESVMISEDMVDKILLTLNPDEREIIYFWAYEGYTAQQISDLLESPRGTILSRIHRIRKRIVKQFGDQLNYSLGAVK